MSLFEVVYILGHLIIRGVQVLSSIKVLVVVS